MPELDQTAMSVLRDSLSNIHFRANRLNEWRELGIGLNKLQGRLEALKKQMETMGAAQKREVQDAIDSCQDTDLLEVRNVIEGIQFIGSPLNANGNGTSFGLLGWMDTLDQFGQTVAQNVAADNFGAAKQDLKKMSRHLSTIVIKRQVQLEFEIGDLRVFSKSLLEKVA